MKGRSLIFTALLSMAVGVALICAYRSITVNHIVLTCGILFILAGVVDMITFVAERDRDGNSRRSGASVAFGWITCTGATILGLAMIIFRSSFINLVPFMFGILVVFASLFQFFLLAVGCRPVRLPGWLYVTPILLMGAGVYLFAANSSTSATVLIVTGASIALFGLTMLIESIMLGTAHIKANRIAKVQAAAPASETSAAAAPASESVTAEPSEPESK